MGPEIRRDEVWILIPLVIVERGLVGAEEFESSNDGFKDRCLKPLDYTPVYMGDVIITHHPCLLLVRISEEYILFI